MKILLTNDDGIHAEGINALYDVLSVKYAVYMIAPDRERSACSNAITVGAQLRLKKVTETKYSLSGYPADCVILGLGNHIINDIDLVVSGINHGPNIGDDIFFSGTVAAARTACIFGRPGIAVSMNRVHEPSKYFHDAADFVVDFIEKHTALLKNIGDNSLPSTPPLFNINYPDISSTKVKGVKFTRVGKRLYLNTFNEQKENIYESTIDILGKADALHNDGWDVTELNKGYISITPLKNEAVHFDLED
jgi:5'-nucleotidase